jgi:flagellar basal body P-ring formation protein FlgA
MTTLAVMNRLLLTLLLALALAGDAWASAALQESVRMHVLREVAAAAGGTQSHIDVVVGEIDPRLQLATCTNTEVFLPAASRFWGRGFAGIRCLEGATWSINIPVTVRVFGPALVATRALAAGSVVQADDVRSAEVEWTREPQGVVTTAAQIDQRVLARAIAMGQPIPLNTLRAVQAVGQGEPVRLVGRGNGFSISAEGIALASATAGQSVRVRTESGKILTGIARAGRLVEVQF